MESIKGYIQQRATECEKRSANWEERIQSYTEKIKSANDEEMQEIKFKLQQCIGKKE